MPEAQWRLTRPRPKAEALCEAGAFDAAAEADVFDDLHAEGFEAADGEIGFAAEEVEGADADGVVVLPWGRGCARGGPPRG